MTSRKLAANVILDGVLYTPESDVPADVAKRIDNPKAWGEQSDADGESKPTKAPAKKAASSK